MIELPLPSRFEIKMPEPEMNRLLLIGNGFDLSHGMKTSYTDFIAGYLKKCYRKAWEERSYSDRLLDIQAVIPSLSEYTFVIKDLDHLIDLYYPTNLEMLLDDEWLEINKSISQRFRNPFQTKINSKFFKSLLNICSNVNWVHIENEYYSALKTILRSSNNKEAQLKELNDSMAAVIQALNEYLFSLPDPPKIGYDGLLNTWIRNNEIIDYDGEDIIPKKIMALNFNYTSTIEIYRDGHININYIHGKINDPDNPIVFGFGDELDRDYELIEDEPIRGFFTHIKSFYYFKTENYYNLVRFIDSEDYQVCIVGHSCGLSDRTMLNMIFEHPNCKSVKIFYHDFGNGMSNHREISEDISRHFKDKAMMRKKIVSFKKCQPMPQAIINQ